MADFDPYLAWLDIPAHERPVNNYRLLGLVPGEMDAVKIEAAASRVKAHLQQFATGQHAGQATMLMGVVDNAKASVLGAARATSAASDQSRAAHGETAIKPPPPVPGAPAPATPQNSPTTGERPMNAAPPPPGGLPRTSSHERQVKPPPPVPGASAAPTIPSGPPPGAPGAATANMSAPPAVPGGPAQISPPPGITSPPPPAPTSRNYGGAETSMPGGPAAPPAASPPIASPPTAAPPVTPVMPVGPSATPAQPPPATPGNAPSWAPAGRTGTVGKSVTAATQGSPRVPVRTRKASTVRHRARRESQSTANAVLFGVAAIIIGLIILLVLVAVS